MYLSKHGSKSFSSSLHQSKTPSCQDIKSLSLIRSDDTKNLKTLYDWKKIIPNAAYFVGDDKYLFGKLLAIVYEDPITEKISTVLIARHGENQYNSLTIDARSRYFPACENLLPEYRRSNVRRSLAITGLRAYANLDINLRNALLENSNSKERNAFDWDETTAGDLASSMELIVNKDPVQIGEKILDLGYLQQKFSNALMLDIIYEDSEREIDENNKLVFLLGEQLDQLFDPLTEYSPESTEKVYKVPPDEFKVPPGDINDDELTSSICEELIKVQTNFTKNLVQFLQNFVVPLRIKVLNNEVGSLTISKFNLIFPPTIDEITRINCIFLDSLKVAMEHGSYEILKACGTTIPYFYKAYMRHEAATKNFSSQLGFFFESFSNLIARDSQIDVDFFTKRKIESLIHGSLNLIKLKLILNRLMENNQWSDVVKQKAEKYYKSSINTIDAFGRDKLKPYSNRVFTPTGKLLTELASGWPVELQYGWLTRRVVSIFGGKNLITNNQFNEDIIIIFSDHILFLTIDDKAYYRRLAVEQAKGNSKNEANNNLKSKSQLEFYKNSNASFLKVHEPSIPDILMHSLINQIPLTNLPHLKVTGWADIGDVYPSTYNEGKMIQFFVVGNGIKTNEPRNIHEIDSIKKYQINDVSKLNNGLKIIDLVNKAKILNKSSPFHLFKTRNLGLSVYSTAHEKAVYVDEKSKSPFALFLNMKINKSYLYQHNLFAGLSAKFIDGENIEVYGLTKDGSTINHTLPSIEFSTFLAEELSNLYSHFLSYKNDAMVNYLIRANDKLGEYLIQYVNDDMPKSKSTLLEADEEREGNFGDEGQMKKQNVDDVEKSVETLMVVDKAGPPEKKLQKKPSVMKLLISPLKRKLANKSARNNNEKAMKSSPIKAGQIKRNSLEKTESSNRIKPQNARNENINKVEKNDALALPSNAAPLTTVTSAAVVSTKNSRQSPLKNTANDTRLSQKFTKSKETLRSVLSSANESNSNTVVINGKASLNELKTQFVTPMKKLNQANIQTQLRSTGHKTKTPTISAQSPKILTSTPTKKKTSFFDKLFRRKQKTPEAPLDSPVKIITNSPDEYPVDIASPTKETKIQRTLNRFFKSSLNIASEASIEPKSAEALTPGPRAKSVNQHIKTTEILLPLKLVKSPSRETVSSYGASTENVHTPYATPSKQIRPTKRKSIFVEQSDTPHEPKSAGDNLQVTQNTISGEGQPPASNKADEFKVRSSFSVNMEGGADLIDNKSSTIRAVQDIKSVSSVAVSPTVRRSASISGSPRPSRISMSVAMSPSRSKRNSKVLGDVLGDPNTYTSRNSSVKSKLRQQQKLHREKKMQAAESALSALESGKENYDHLEEITKMKLAKENYENLQLIRNHHKSGTESKKSIFSATNDNAKENENNLFVASLASQTDSKFNFNTNNTNSIKESIRNSLFVDDYSDNDDDDVKKNWVIARENSSLTNIEKVGSLLSGSNNSDRMLKSRSAASRNWTLTRDSSSINFSKYSFKKTESGFSIYNDFVDETVAPNWIIARDNSTLLNIPKEISSKMIGPERSLSRSKNISLLPYQNQIRHSLNSLRIPNADALDDNQKLYALLLSKEKFDESANDISRHGSSKYITKDGHLSDDEGRFHDEDGEENFDISDDDDDEEHDERNFEGPESNEDDDDDNIEEKVEEGDDGDAETDNEAFDQEEDDFITPDNIGDDEFEEIKFDKIANEHRGSSLLSHSFRFHHAGVNGFDSDEHESDNPVHEGLIDEDLLDEEEDDNASFDEPKQHGLMSTLPTISSFGDAQKISHSEDYRSDLSHRYGDDDREISDKDFLKAIVDESESSDAQGEDDSDIENQAKGSNTEVYSYKHRYSGSMSSSRMKRSLSDVYHAKG